MDPDKYSGKITFEHGKKFDLQLTDALIAEKRLADLFIDCDIRKLELKTESWQWEQTGNLCIEYMWDGAPSGVMATQSTCWVHELRWQNGGGVYIFWPLETLKTVARAAYRAKLYKKNCGDDGKSCVIKIPISWLVRGPP